MKATTILALVAIVAAFGAVTAASMIPVHQVSAQVGGKPSSPPNSHAANACNHAGAGHVPFC